MTTTIVSNDETRFSETLYKVHSNGKIGSWSANVVLHDDETATLTVTTEKVLGGKKVDTPTHYTEGKNIGKSNETTPLMQATFEAQSKIKKKLDSGYVNEMPKPGETATNASGRVMPMLAKKLSEIKELEFPLYSQCKLDGNRGLAVYDGRPVLYSRKGQEITSCPHIIAELQKMYDAGHWDGRTLDGEIYKHGVPLQTINSWVKKEQPESLGLTYFVYDSCDTPGGYEERKAYLDKMFSNWSGECVTPLGSVLCTNMADVDNLHAQYVEKSYEGSILRTKGVDYPTGGPRCSQLIKKKDYQDEEFEIVGLSEGKATRNGFKVGIYHCKTAEGKVFTVTAPGNEKEKHEHAERGKANIGRLLTCKYFCYTVDGKPSQPTAVALRNEI